MQPHRRGPRIESRLRHRAWISVQVELVEGRGEHYWPRPGRILAAAADHSFAQLATAIDGAFARWDRSHLHEFELGDGTRIGTPGPDMDNDDVLDESRDFRDGYNNPEHLSPELPLSNASHKGEDPTGSCRG